LGVAKRLHAYQASIHDLGGNWLLDASPPFERLLATAQKAEIDNGKRTTSLIPARNICSAKF
jgi:hypothetical protein